MTKEKDKGKDKAPDEVERFEAVCDKQELTELKILRHALFVTIGSYRDEPSAANKKNWDAASAGYKETVARLTEKYFPNEVVGRPAPLAHLKAAAAYLITEGWKVGKSKVYQDAQLGRIRVQEDRTVEVADALDYARKYLERSSIPDADQVDDLLRVEKQSQIELIQARKRKLDFEDEQARGRYLDRDAVLLEWSVKLGLLEAYLKNAARTRSVEWAVAVRGDPDRADVLYGMIAAEVDAVLEQLADLQEIKVRVRRNTEVPF